MKLFDRALLVADLAPGWGEAVATATVLQRTFATEVLPLHVIPGALEDVLDKRRLGREIEGRIQQVRRFHGGECAPFAAVAVEVGPRFDRVLSEADAWPADLILVGAGIDGSQEAIRVGTTAARIVRHARQPVWVAKPGAPPRPRRILCPVDMSGSARRALRVAIRLAAALEARLTVLHVIGPLTALHFAAAELPDHERLDSAHEGARRAEFEAFVDGIDFERTPWVPSVREGDARQEILAAVDEQAHDLIVIGTVGRNALTRLLIGSVTERVLRDLPCSVVAVKDGGAARARMSDDLEFAWNLGSCSPAGSADDVVAAFERSGASVASCPVVAKRATRRGHAPVD